MAGLTCESVVVRSAGAAPSALEVVEEKDEAREEDEADGNDDGAGDEGDEVSFCNAVFRIAVLSGQLAVFWLFRVFAPLCVCPACELARVCPCASCWILLRCRMMVVFFLMAGGRGGGGRSVRGRAQRRRSAGAAGAGES